MEAPENQRHPPDSSQFMWRFLYVYVPIAVGAWLIHNGFTLVGAALIIWGMTAI